ncbi:TIGR03503 family protein [Alteromonas sp. H39]|uniref:TIGR03503 family protein n=1 Tax=Alteromonas sp. H39 TaxID=3389876 RepID=UPI0039DFF666
MGRIWGIVLLMISGLCAAQEPVSADAQNQPDSESAAGSSSPLTELGTEYQNSIELLRNRFRIDYKVDEITMVFFREYGSAPVVLVRPDGSKIFQSQVEGDDIFWYDADTYDMISIKNPVPGPWQAVGRILPGSRVMVLSDIQLHADKLPSIIFSGEILKSTAYLSNDGQPIDYNEFRDVVELTIELISTNNPNYDNFGANDQLIATFEDNGRGMDEAPLDGTFTGQFNLSVPSGEWKPVFTVTTPMFTRKQENAPILLYPNPIKLDIELDGGGDGYHKLLIDADRELVDIESLLIDGKIRFPNGDMQNFSLTEPNSNIREHLIVAYEEGVFRVKLTAYGTTSEGRDFILDVPEYTFLAEAPEPEVVDPMLEETPTSDEEQPAVMDTSMDLESEIGIPDNAAESEATEEMDDNTIMMLIVGVNGTIVVIGLLVVTGVMVKRKMARKRALKPSEPTVSGDAATNEHKSGSWFSKLTGMFKKSG